jgi:hypothetical protein
MRTGFLNNPQSGWVSRSGDMLFLKSYEVRLLPLINSFLKAISPQAKGS